MFCSARMIPKEWPRYKKHRGPPRGPPQGYREGATESPGMNLPNQTKTNDAPQIIFPWDRGTCMAMIITYSFSKHACVRIIIRAREFDCQFPVLRLNENKNPGFVFFVQPRLFYFTCFLILVGWLNDFLAPQGTAGRS